MTAVPDPSARAGGPGRLARLAHASPVPLAVPICTYPAMALTGATVRQIVSDASANAETQQAYHERYRTPVVLTAMDLSAEAEAFGCEVLLSDTDLPTVVGRLVTTVMEASARVSYRPGGGCHNSTRLPSSYGLLSASSVSLACGATWSITFSTAHG